MQTFEVEVPAGVEAGQNFQLNLNGQMMQVAAQGPAGTKMQIQAPAAPVAAGVPVTGTPAPFGNQLAAAGVAPGNGFLAGIKGLYCRQHIEVLELLTGCEAKNRYSFTPIPMGTEIPAAPTSSWSSGYRSAAGFNPLLKAKEESECFERVCCPLFRSFTMNFKDGNGTDFITINRPFKCDPCYAPPCCMCVSQEMSISASGSPVANAKEVTGFCCTTGCCQRKFETYDNGGKLMYTMEVNDCSSKSGGCNCLAPSLCNEALTVDITAADGTLMPASTFVWPGCNCGGLTDLSNMVIQFPEGSSPDERTAILAGMMLIEFTVMEQRRQNNNNNNGGGGGGAPPTSEEMQR